MPVVLATEDGVITYVNERFEQAFGWTREELVGRLLTTIIPPRFHDAHHLGLSRFLLTGVPTLLGRPVALEIMTKDGTERPTEHVISAERVEGRWHLGATIRPLDRSTEEPA